MTYPPYLRAKARELRIERKLSLDEIAERLALGKTTVWYWIKDLPDREIKHRETAGRRRARAAAAESNKRRFRVLRKAAYQEGWDEYPALIEEPTFRDFVCLYLGEGYKRNRNKVSICNSDPRIIWLSDRWIREYSRNKIAYSIQYHADQDLDDLRSFWALRLPIEKTEIRLQRKSNSGQLKGRMWRSKHGVLTIAVGDTHLRMRLEAWMNRLQDGWIDSLHGV